MIAKRNKEIMNMIIEKDDDTNNITKVVINPEIQNAGKTAR